jgi:hypothetical protein
MRRIAVFVSPHGFGHAARASAVMQALHRLNDDVRCDIFTTVPRWFFAESLDAPFAHHPLETDIGLVQRTSLHEDLRATAARLGEVRPGLRGCTRSVADRLERLGCSLVVSDISPLGLAAASAAGIPSVLVENFTWDWIYDRYAASCPELTPHGEAVAEVVALADLRIQATPACHGVAAALTVPPISRPPRVPRSEVRARLGVPQGAPMVLLTMGGVPWSYSSLDRLRRHPEACFVVPGGAHAAPSGGRLVTLPHRSDHYHPDLVGAADLVVGKLGYSTLAEVYHAGAVYAFVARHSFPESEPLTRFVLAHMPSFLLDEQTFASCRWVDRLDELLGLARQSAPSHPNGADQTARAILELL